MSKLFKKKETKADIVWEVHRALKGHGHIM